MHTHTHMHMRSQAQSHTHTRKPHIHHQRPGGALRALAVLRKPSCPRELVYRFAPALVAEAPEEAVDMLVGTHPPLEPRWGVVCSCVREGVRVCVCVRDKREEKEGERGSGRGDIGTSMLTVPAQAPHPSSEQATSPRHIGTRASFTLALMLMLRLLLLLLLLLLPLVLMLMLLLQMLLLLL